MLQPSADCKSSRRNWYEDCKVAVLQQQRISSKCMLLYALLWSLGFGAMAGTTMNHPCTWFRHRLHYSMSLSRVPLPFSFADMWSKCEIALGSTYSQLLSSPGFRRIHPGNPLRPNPKGPKFVEGLQLGDLARATDKVH